ncbi:MAG: hypothetical protein LBU38_02500, partial [Propionibacteriaceae bacterium]|nr:hypothetical protein [Propionibacteriaceae bacterium]
MSLYIDSADLVKVSRLLASGVFEGVTTNPTILARAGLSSADRPQLFAQLKAAGAKLVFMQATGATAADIAKDASFIREIDPAIVVKIPATEAGVTVAAKLARDSYLGQGRHCEVLLTAVYHPTQALLAAGAGVQYIAPYFGRLNDQGFNGQQIVAQIGAIATANSIETVVASLRSLDDLPALAAAGVPSFTLSDDLAIKLLNDPLTD